MVRSSFAFSEVWVRRAAIALALLVSPAFVGAQTTKPTPDPAAAQAGLDGWKKIEGKSFSFYGPKDLEGGPKHGIDTAVYDYENKQLRVSFDIGALANPLLSKPTKVVVVDGRDAAIVHGIRQSLLYVRLDKYTNFNMYVASDSPELREIAEKMFMSVRFKEK